MDDKARFDAAIARIDAANATDPRTERVGETDVPKELVYGRRMSEVLARFAPDASEALRLAARAQHVRRFDIPRDRYPMDRKGYLQWRAELSKLHARVAGELLREVGYDEATIELVTSLVQKKHLARDADSQTLEDVACQVFLEHYFAELAVKHDDDKLVGILAKTWAKMSARGHDFAREIALGDRGARLLGRALSSAAPSEH